MSYKYYIGADISKHTLDFTILNDGEFLLHETIKNNKDDIQLWLSKIMTLYKAGGKKTLYCIEKTGSYQKLLVDALLKRKVPVWMEGPLQIHLSLGLKRGKNDKLDSSRIASYAYTFRNNAKLWQPPREVIDKLQQLRSLRERLVTIKMQLQHEIREVKGFIKRNLHLNLLDHCQGSLAAVLLDINKVEGSMADLINKDERLNKLYGWLTSIQGIGKVLATEMIITTNEFLNFSSSKKYACYCGVAPFRYTSGVKNYGKAKVSRHANKRMRRLLHIAAMSSIRLEGDYKEYYQRRVNQGLNKTSVINIIRNKLIRRAFACVKEERMYNSKAKLKEAS